MGIPTPPIYLIIYDHAISNILKTQLKLFTIFLIELTYWHHFQNDELKKKVPFPILLVFAYKCTLFLFFLYTWPHYVQGSTLWLVQHWGTSTMKALQEKKKKWQNKKNSIYQGTSMLAGATGNVYAKQQENKTK